MKRFVVFLFVFCVCTNGYSKTQTINWWVGGQSYQTTTCETGGSVTPPANPTKRGHHFTGWEVALYDFSTLDASVNGSKYNNDWTNLTWTTTFDYGVVSGEALCSTTNGTLAQTGNPNESATGGQFCWCKATTYIPNASNIVYENVLPSMWVYRSRWTSNCVSYCVDDCGYLVRDDRNFRRALFGITQ